MGSGTHQGSSIQVLEGGTRKPQEDSQELSDEFNKYTRLQMLLSFRTFPLVCKHGINFSYLKKNKNKQIKKLLTLLSFLPTLLHFFNFTTKLLESFQGV
jgi:hypothetical protein